MINNLYTTFEHLVHTRDEDMTSLFYMLLNAREKSSSPSDSRYMQMMTMRDHVTREDAHRKMAEVLDILNGCGNDIYSGLNKLQDILTTNGMMQLLNVLYTKTTEQDEDIIASFTSPADILDSFFKGMPLFRVVVEDAEYSSEECQKSEGRYIVYLENCVTNVRDKITFKNKDSKILYLWFLTHPRESFVRSGSRGIVGHKQELLYIANKCYDNHSCEAYLDKMHDKFVDDNADRLDETMAEFIKVAKKDANYVINTALDGKDVEGWYIIEIGNDGKSGANKYALSLPQDFINLPQSLKNLEHA